MGVIRAAVLLGAGLLAHGPAAAWADARAALEVHGAWSRPTPPGVSVGAVYLSIANHSDMPDRLLSVSSPIAPKIEIHHSREAGGVMQMRAVPFLECPAGATVKVEPGGVHIMLLGLKEPLVAGSSFPLTLQFRDAGQIALKVAVQTHE